MGLLLLLVGLLAAISGGLKLRQRVRSTLGLSRLAVAELVVGVLVVLGSGLGLSRTGAGWWVVIPTLLLVFASSIHQGRRVVEHRKRRDRSEALRLELYLKSRDQAERGDGGES
ncbi:MAG: hypothetical protein GTN62_03230 [Gemmatimonadales bacterium]|nr:hypothetical protein [Gemmatimonadales bacterium]NIN49113.1 hypothetical protein [Gemmatimonadales bacterium]NIP06577.1 hypothetical protein [Gemmatimonadales bacterium]NIR00274.1 hypothetical protein [Gemmatimonadales bacterium]NIS64607.1 hypothetical protein [Gemmatimonadales bacterium]